LLGCGAIVLPMAEDRAVLAAALGLIILRRRRFRPGYLRPWLPFLILALASCAAQVYAAWDAQIIAALREGRIYRGMSGGFAVLEWLRSSPHEWSDAVRAIVRFFALFSLFAIFAENPEGRREAGKGVIAGLIIALPVTILQIAALKSGYDLVSILPHYSE